MYIINDVSGIYYIIRRIFVVLYLFIVVLFSIINNDKIEV